MIGEYPEDYFQEKPGIKTPNADQEDGLDLKPIISRLLGKTPGVWSLEEHGEPGTLTLYSDRITEGDFIEWQHGLNLLTMSNFDWNKENNLDFIVNAPRDMVDMVGEIYRLRNIIRSSKNK